MSSLVTTIIIASLLVLLAVAGLAIGLLLTGKSRLKGGRCGWDPNQKRGESCGKKISCALCKREKEDE